MARLFIAITAFLLWGPCLFGQARDTIPDIDRTGGLILDVFPDSLSARNRERTLNPFGIDSLGVDSIVPNKYYYISQSALDSLLRPYYTITFDSISGDTLGTNIRLSPKYRMKIEPLKGDTLFVPMPQGLQPIEVYATHTLDTMEIPKIKAPATIRFNKRAADPEWWDYENSIGLDISQVAFVNWNAGGNNSVSGLLKLYLSRTYEKAHTLWDNEISARYGLNEQEDKGLIKTDDEIKMSSSFGYRKDTLSNWYYSAQLNFRTQFTNGYNYPDTDTPISRFFAPAYLFLGVGAKYNLKTELLSVYLSPLTLKATYVFDDALSESGSFGVDPGQRSRHEFGTLVRIKWEKEVFENVAVTNDLELYTDYVNDFGNIDVDWVFNFRFKINSFLQASLRTHLIYDNDIKIAEDTNGDGELETLGARVQLKQQLGIGLLYKF